ncbi:hypothetical protein V6Z12_D06G122600 [Gossypium hirsutum]
MAPSQNKSMFGWVYWHSQYTPNQWALLKPRLFPCLVHGNAITGSLYRTDDVPQDMVDRRVEVVARLKALEDAAAPLVTFLQNDNAVQELRADKQYNLQMLNDRYQIGPDQIEALYQYAKFQFECGNYSGAADYLYQYRALCTNSERSLSALWGKLAAEILMQNWDIALEELNRLKEIIDSKSFSSPLNQVQSRIWLMHWSLFIFFNHDNGRTQIIDLFNQDKEEVDELCRTLEEKEDSSCTASDQFSCITI